jgi:hypothetical protein
MIRNLLAAVALSAVAGPCMAQTYGEVTPPGGLTVKTIAPGVDGWGFVDFAEALPELNACPTITINSVSYTQPLWIPMGASNGYSGKYVSAALLMASILGKKIEGISFYVGSSNCTLHTIRVTP